MLTGIARGSTVLPWDDILRAIGLAKGNASAMIGRIVLDVRLPRMLLAAMAGAGLGMVGALLQTATRNDLADPFLFGLSSGASAGAVVVITRLGDRLGVWTLPLATFVGGMLSSIVVMLLFLLQRSRGADRIIICGLAIAFLFSALTNYLVFSGDQRAASAVLFWSLGGLGLASWDNLFLAVGAVALLSGFTLCRWRQLDALLAGEQVAVSLGVALSRLRIELFLLCALATSMLVSVTGVIGFIGLMVPHLARAICGVRHRQLMPLCGVIGAVLLCAGDILSRTLLAPQELPVGIVTSGLGGLFVLFLVLRN